MTAYHALPRLGLSPLPTPIEGLPRLSAALGGPQIYIKRDDLSGLGGGGNKIRKLDLLLADARSKGADTILTCGAIQSNHARLTAAAAAKHGLASVLLLEEGVAWDDPAYAGSGNRLLDGLFGSRVITLPGGSDLLAAMQTEADTLRAAGRTPYCIPVGGSNGLGSLGYVACMTEIAGDGGPPFDEIILPTGSGGTQAGLLLGAALTGLATPILGIGVSKPADRQIALVRGLIAEARALCPEIPDIADSAIRVDDRHYLPAYGIPHAGVHQALSLCARTEGLLLDPVYTGKAMAGLIARIAEGHYRPEQKLLFLHTGGSPALYAYADWLRG